MIDEWQRLHDFIHLQYRTTQDEKRREILKKLHDYVVGELSLSGVTHPLKDDLDRQPRAHPLSPFRIKHPYVVITGSIVYGSAVNDIDFLVFGSLHSSVAQLTIDVIRPSLKGVSVQFSDNFYGTPFSPYLPVYSLLVTLHKPREVSFGFAPMYPKDVKSRFNIKLADVLRRLPESTTLLSPFIYFDSARLVFYIRKLSGEYFVPVYVRLLRQFPPQVRDRLSVRELRVDEEVPPNAEGVYDLVLERLPLRPVERL